MEELRRLVVALELVRLEHPTATISKIRYLEVEGRVSTVVDDDGNRWVRARDICRALTAERRREHVVDHEACPVIPLRRRHDRASS